MVTKAPKYYLQNIPTNKIYNMTEIKHAYNKNPYGIIPSKLKDHIPLPSNYEHKHSTIRTHGVNNNGEMPLH
jgi:hypothetical protein